MKNTAAQFIIRICEKITSPIFHFGNTRPYYLAKQLLDEIENGMEPVWPTTEVYADTLVEGLEIHCEKRSKTVFKAILLAPQNGPIDWKSKLENLLN